jgi:superfamily II DNA or RNA helicase
VTALVAAIPAAARALVAAHFAPAIVDAAIAHAAAARVQVVKAPPWPVVARVKDGAAAGEHVVTVHYNPLNQHLRGDCSCSDAVDCVHAAAAALIAFADEAAQAAAQAEVARQAAVGEWLAELGQHAPEAPAAAPGERVVAYVLDDRDGEVGLTIVACARLKAGGLAAGAPIAGLGEGPRGAPRWLATDDLRRIALVRAVARAVPGATRLGLERVDAALVRDLAASGHLYWGSIKTAPLGYGPPRTSRLDWRPVDGAAGLARLGLAAELAIVPARDGHYVDPARALIGPLELGVPAALWPRLLASPPVPVAMRATVARSLGALVAAPHASASSPAAPLGAIAPSDAIAANTAITALQPCLRAHLDPDDRNTIVLDGTARYGDLRFPLGAWDPARPHPRDLIAEGRCLARLRAIGAALPHGLVAASSLELLASSRHLAEVVVPQLRAAGWSCILAEDFPHDAPLVDVAWVAQLRPRGDGHAWFALELGVTIAGRTVPLLPILLEAIRRGQLVIDPAGGAQIGAGLNLRLPEGELVHVPAERLARWLRPLLELELRGVDATGALIVPPVIAAELAADAADLAAPGPLDHGGALTAARAHLAGLLDLAPRAAPIGFGGVLRDYQQVGLAWLRFLHDAGYGGLLADEMGLGKTVQVLAFLEDLRAACQLSAPALVVAPRSVLGTWAREAARFAPALRAVVHVGGARAEEAAALTAADLIITSYQTLVRDRALLGPIRWTTIIFDEAQALKNPDTQLRAAAAGLAAHSRFCVTGTPIENHLGELWSQLDLAMPGVLGRRKAFDAVYRRAIEERGDRPRLELLRARIRPFLLRRTKERVLAELPPKTEIIERIELDAAQRDLYETLRLTLDDRVRKALALRGLQGASMVILDALLKLRQCCCDPRLVKVPATRAVSGSRPAGRSSAAARSALGPPDDAAGVQPDAAHLRFGSAKLERLLEMLTELVDSDRSTLVFSQFATMLGLIEAACARAGLATLTLTGATRDRDDVIRRFQAGHAKIFLVSLKAGGVGLNLTRADTVIHYDPWWNPAAEAQATDRAHRIGQDKPVMVYKLVARGTLEETICTLQDEKRALTEAALQDGGVTHLAADDLRALFARIV